MIKCLTIRNLKLFTIVFHIIVGIYLICIVIYRPDIIGTWWGKIVLNYEMTIKK